MGFKSDRPAPLSGIRILDFADEKAAFCTRLLGEMGARVIKVEKPGGDSARKTGPFHGRTSQCATSLPFFYNNTNKLGITLDLECEEGQEILVRLIKEADVIVETFAAAFLSRRGLSVDAFRSANPRIIWVSITGFGRSGPRRDHEACDLVLSASGGQMYTCGSPAAAPLKAFGGQSHYAASLFAATAILLALRRRRRTGAGDHIDVSMQAAVTATLEHVMHRYFAEGIVHRRTGNLHWNEDFCVLPCKDGHIQATLLQQWETLIEWLDAEGLAADLKDEKWRDEAYRREHLSHVIEVLKKWTAGHTRAEIFELAQLMRFPWAPVQTPGEILECPHLRSRNFFVEQACPESGNSLKYPGRPYSCSNGPAPPREPAPRTGEHNDKIYRQELRIPEKKLKQLYARKII